ncbi:MAG TPA: LPS export ABC transporter periplasmic protein LptC [Candidatus Binatia bacterium]|nr:LPS export ABC transporter periplasmic protein LptC [Candidatus Binatia bacterium]
MRKPTRLILLAAILLSLGGLVYKAADTFWVMKVEEFKKNPIKALDAIPESALQIKDFRRAKIENGRKLWELFGDEANYFKEQKEAAIKRPRFYYYNEKGEIVETTGDHARLFFDDKELEKMQLEGEVQVTFQGYVLRSAEATYFADTARIVLPKRAVVTGNGLEVEGSTMEIDLEVKKVRLLRNVKTKIEPDKLARKDRRAESNQMSGG